MLLLPGISTSKNPKQGSTLLLSLLATVAVVSLSAIFLQLTSSVAKRQSQSADQKRSFYLAEAGLAESFAGLRIGKSGSVGTEAKPALYGNGLFWVTSTDIGDGLLLLESTGMCGSTRSKLDLVVSEGVASVAALGVFSAGDLTISSGSSLVSFDSEAGGGGGGGAFGGSGQQMMGGGQEALAAPVKIEGRIALTEDIGTAGVARVSTNGNITITQALGEVTQVLGDLRPGISGTLTQNGSPNISGSVAPLVAAVRLPPIDVPVYTQRAGYVHSDAQPFVVPPFQGSYQFLGVLAGTELTITGPSVIVLEQLVVYPGAQVTFDTASGPIDIYITDKLDLKSGSFLDVTSASALDLSIQISGTQSAELRGTCDYQGTLFAPTAEIIVEEGFDVFGSVVANQLTLEGAVQMSFDEALGRAAERDALPVLVSWRILELSPNAYESGDPCKDLGIDRSSLDNPTKSHEDQILEMAYVDSAGDTQNYSGWESDFDWSGVGQVLNITRDGESVGRIEGLASIGSTGDGTGIIGTDTTGTRTPSRTAALNSL